MENLIEKINYFVFDTPQFFNGECPHDFICWHDEIYSDLFNDSEIKYIFNFFEINVNKVLTE